MELVRKRVFACAFAAGLVVTSTALANDRETRPHDRDRPGITKIIKHFLAQILGDISVPPG